MVPPRVAMNQGLLRTWLILGRVSNLPTVWANATAGWLLAGGGWTAGLGWTLLGLSLLYIAGMTLNDACDAVWDRTHAPDRPIPSGAISRRAVWLTGLVQMGAGAAVLGFCTRSAPPLILALMLAILWYDVSHKRNAAGPWVMGLCRFLIYPLAASAAGWGWDDPQLSGGRGVVTLVLFALGLYAYVVALTYTAKAERAASSDPASRGPLLVWFLLAVPLGFNLLVGLWWAGLPLLGWILFARTLRQRRRIDIGRLVGLLLAGMVLVDVMAVCLVVGGTGLALIALVPLNLALQRVIPAT